MKKGGDRQKMGKISIRDVVKISLGKVIKQGKGWSYFFAADGKPYLVTTIGGQMVVLTETEYKNGIRRGRLYEEQVKRYKK